MHRNWLILVFCLMIATSLPNRVEAVQEKGYQVKPGDSLWSIARNLQVDMEQLKNMNQIKNDWIQPGMVLTLPTKNVKQDLSKAKRKMTLTKKDFNWLVRIIEAEAGGENFEGKVGVGSVVRNRVLNDDYPETVTSVIFHKVGGVYQFSPVADGRIYKVVPSEESYRAARTALKGVDPTAGALFFYNPKTARGSWIRSRVVSAEIGRHHFAY
jgi:N-acetylmuramoyl-L-alanine amidase